MDEKDIGLGHKVIPLWDPGPTVTDVLESVDQDASGLRSIVVVGVGAADGEITVWASGRLEDICASALMAQEYAKLHLRGELE